MKSYIFVDKKNKAYGKIVENKLEELKFYNPYLYNIYRVKVVNKIESINAYFCEYENNKNGFLKSKKNFAIGDSIIAQLIKESYDDKLASLSANFKIENEDYYLYRFKNKGYPKLKKGKKFNEKSRESLIKIKDMLIKEENFIPSPKLLLENNSFEIYKNQNKEFELVETDILENKIIYDSLKSLKSNKLYKDDISIIINELETLTVIDVNSSKKKSSLEKDDFYFEINKNIIDFIIYNLKLRNIGGMIVIDFLRSDRNEQLVEEFNKKLRENFENFRSYGFSQMGLYELSIERNGKSLYKSLKERELI